MIQATPQMSDSATSDASGAQGRCDQAAFRLVLHALSRPGTIVELAGDQTAPVALHAAAAAVALTLFDFETPVWLDGRLAGDDEVVDFLRFGTGAPVVAALSGAAFAFVADGLVTPPLADFALGSNAAPETSTTVIIQTQGLRQEGGWTLTGPGIKDVARLTIDGLRSDFAAEMIVNHGLFPQGVDVIFAAGNRLAALPRTTRVEA